MAFIVKIKPMKIGVLSDTHGIIPDTCLEILKDVKLLIHAGDIGGLGVIERLRELADVKAVCGNMDSGALCKRFPRTYLFEIKGKYFYLMHEPYLLDIDPKAAGVDCVIYGHTHIPKIEERDGVLYLNPGSVGVPKLGLGPTVALLEITEDKINAKIVEC